MSQQLLIVEMFIITLVTRVLYRRQYDPIPDLDDDVEETKTVLTSKKAVDIAWEEQTFETSEILLYFCGWFVETNWTMMVINFVFSICMYMLVSKILPDLFFIDVTASYLAIEFDCRVNHGFEGPDWYWCLHFVLCASVWGIRTTKLYLVSHGAHFWWSQIKSFLWLDGRLQKRLLELYKGQDSLYW